MYLLGYDLGSSSVKAALVDAQTLETLGYVHYPETEMQIIAHQKGWAEQEPDMWWSNLQAATHKLFQTYPVDRSEVMAIGLSYQMHGLVLIDQKQQVLRPSIIWCDSRAVDIGEEALQSLGPDYCFDHLLNAPGNFTASRLKWVKDHEPELFDKADKMLLPGDFIHMKLTGEVNTTIAALSEGIFWDFKEHGVSDQLLSYMGLSPTMIPEIVEVCQVQGHLSVESGKLLGLKPGIPVGYRAGDQPNNALCLNVLKPGEIAATGGTSGVVFGISDQPVADRKSRINAFAHVNHSQTNPRLGMLLCINGAGIQYGWLKQMLAAEGTSYTEIERLIESIPVNSDGLTVIPFGNGAERMLGNRDTGARLLNLNFNRHRKAHLYRAALEGIAYAFVHGIDIMKSMGMPVDKIKVGNDNLFQSSVFATTIASLLGCEIEMLDATGAVGAAKAAGVGTGLFDSLEDVMKQQKVVKTYTADRQSENYHLGFDLWKAELQKLLY